MSELVEGLAAHFRGLGFTVTTVRPDASFPTSMEVTMVGNWRNFILLFEDDGQVEMIGDPDIDTLVMSSDRSLFDSYSVDLADPRSFDIIEAALRRRMDGA